MSPARKAFLDGLKHQTANNLRETVRPALVHGRRSEASVDPNLLPESPASHLRAPTGEFYFVLGYSKLDGPDILAP